MVDEVKEINTPMILWLYWNCTTPPNKVADLLLDVPGAIARGHVDMAHESSVAKTGLRKVSA